MRIKKTFQGSLPENTVVNTQSDSQTNAYSCDYLNKSLKYSTSETFTGKYWIDGKKIYRLVMPITTNGTYIENGFRFTWVSLSDLNISTLTEDTGWVNTSNRRISTSSDDLKFWYLTDKRLQIGANNSYVTTSSSGYAILEYTKTTD